MSDNGLGDYTDEALYDFLDHLTEYRRQNGRGRSPEAYHIRHYCGKMRKKVKAELKRRELPATRPGDKRVYGPGQQSWQEAQTEAA
jgi:hypothetical protein